MNYYQTLGMFLSPFENAARIDHLRTLLRTQGHELGWLLYTANLHLCTPLWFVRLKREGLFCELPEELQEYLQQLYLANAERNAELKAGLRELIGELAKEGIETLLLKGAASLADNLYEDAGARVMGDLDLLVTPREQEAARAVLLRLGYVKGEEGGLDFDRHPRGYRHFHLPAYHRPGTPLVVEIHAGLGHGQVEKLLPAEAVWQDADSVTIDGCRTRLPAMQWRLLHNMAHALIPEREFIRSEVSLRQLAEFGFLVKGGSASLDGPALEERLVRCGLRSEFSAYLALAQRCLGMSWPTEVDRSLASSFHVWRCCLAGSDQVQTAVAAEKGGRPVGIRRRRALFRTYFWLKLPGWVWRNARYPLGTNTVWARLRHLALRLFDPQSRRDTGR